VRGRDLGNPRDPLAAMNQIERSPAVVFCHTMSAWPSPLKSLEPAIDHTVDTCGSAAQLETGIGKDPSLVQR
jgi:hypothetical protein